MYNTMRWYRADSQFEPPNFSQRHNGRLILFTIASPPSSPPLSSKGFRGFRVKEELLNNNGICGFFFFVTPPLYLATPQIVRRLVCGECHTIHGGRRESIARPTDTDTNVNNNSDNSIRGRLRVWQSVPVCIHAAPHRLWAFYIIYCYAYPYAYCRGKTVN